MIPTFPADWQAGIIPIFQSQYITHFVNFIVDILKSNFGSLGFYIFQLALFNQFITPFNKIFLNFRGYSYY